MLTPREFEQLKAAILCMEAKNLVNGGGDHVLRHNVLILVARFAEEGSSCYEQKKKKTTR